MSSHSLKNWLYKQRPNGEQHNSVGSNSVAKSARRWPRLQIQSSEETSLTVIPVVPVVPAEMRKYINGLITIVQACFRLDPFSSAMFVFTNHQRNKIKILQWDMNGFWIHYKRIESGKFLWPRENGSEVVEHEAAKADCACPTCQRKMEIFAYRESIELVFNPAVLKRVIHRYPVLTCTDCKINGIQSTILETRRPEALLPKTMASPSIAAHIITQKYVMALPLYRQEMEWEQMGIHLSRQTQSDCLPAIPPQRPR